MKIKIKYNFTVLDNLNDFLYHFLYRVHGGLYIDIVNL